MDFKVIGETELRIERLAKITGRTPKEVVEAALGLWEQALLTSMPVERRSGYMAGVLQYAVVTTPPPKPQKPLQVERYNAYVPMTDEYD